MKALLLNREWNINGNWYQPKEFLRLNFKSTEKVELLHTTSSAGDWDGYFTQKINGVYYGIRFWQENNWPKSNGFTLRTDKKFIKSTNPKKIEEFFVNNEY